VLTVLLPFAAIVVLATVLLAPYWQPDPGGGHGLLLPLNAILFPYTVPVCLTALYAGAMNSLGMFALPAAVPIVLNVVWIGALYLLQPCGVTGERDIATFVAWFLCFGGAAQLLLVTLPLWRRGALQRPRLGLPARSTTARAVFLAMGPTVVGMSLNQVSGLLDQLMAVCFVGEGANTCMYLANRLLLFPHALTALSVAVAVFPRLAHQATDIDRAAMRKTLDLAASATLLITLPAAIGLMVLGSDIVHVLFQREKFTPEAATQTAMTAACLVAGLPFMGLAQLYARAFYAVGDTRTPARFAAIGVLCNFLLNIAMVLLFHFGTPGLAAATSVSSAINALLLQQRLRRHVPVGGGLLGSWLRNGVATAVMGAAILLLRPTVAADASRLQLLGWRVLLPIAAGMALYFAVHLLLRSPELAVLRRRGQRPDASLP